MREAETKLTEALQHQSELSEQLERDLVSFETSKQADTSSPDIATNPGSRTRQPNDKAVSVVQPLKAANHLLISFSLCLKRSAHSERDSGVLLRRVSGEPCAQV